MKASIIALWVLLFASVVSAEPLVEGISIAEARKILKSARCDKAFLAMGTTDRALEMEHWRAGEGVLMILFQRDTGKVASLTFMVMDERPKGERKVFYFPVTSFDPATGAMSIQIPKPQPKDKAGEKSKKTPPPSSPKKEKP